MNEEENNSIFEYILLRRLMLMSLKKTGNPNKDATGFGY